MNIKEVKIGETYLLPVTVNTIEKCGWIEVATCDNIERMLAPPEVETLLPISTKNTETAPKYNPNRPFCEGDIVRFKKVNGNNARCRYNGTEIKEGSLGRIYKKEGRNCFWVEFNAHHTWCLDAAYFELVTPIEKLEPYRIDPRNTNVIFKHGKKFATFEDDDEAQELCDRLNAEYHQSTINNQQLTINNP